MANNPKIKKGEQPPWLKKHSFANKPENISGKGRGKTSLVSLAKKWKEEGEDAVVDKKKLQEIFKYMLGDSVRNVEKIAKDKDSPMAVVMLAQAILEDKNKAKNLMDTLIWLFGKEAQKIEVSKSISTEHISDEAREEIRKAANRRIG